MVALGTRQIHLIDIAGEQYAFRRDKFKMKRGHCRTPSLRRLGELFALFDGFVDGADHIEGGFRQMIVFAFDQALEAFDGILQVDELARRTGEYFGDEEWL